MLQLRVVTHFRKLQSSANDILQLNDTMVKFVRVSCPEHGGVIVFIVCTYNTMHYIFLLIFLVMNLTHLQKFHGKSSSEDGIKLS